MWSSTIAGPLPSAWRIAMEQATHSSSINGQILPADRTIQETNETIKINWLIEAAGK